MERQRWWAVVRVDEQLLLGSYRSKDAALAAAIRFAQDGCAYEVVEQLVARGDSHLVRCEPSRG